MPKNELQPQQDKLIDQYRAIGPAMLVAALMSKNARTGETRRPSNSNSILASKKAD